MTSFAVPALASTRKQLEEGESLFNTLNLRVQLNRQAETSARSRNVKMALGVQPDIPSTLNSSKVEVGFELRDKVISYLQSLTGNGGIASAMYQYLKERRELGVFRTLFPVFKHEHKSLKGTSLEALKGLWAAFKTAHMAQLEQLEHDTEFFHPLDPNARDVEEEDKEEEKMEGEVKQLFRRDVEQYHKPSIKGFELSELEEHAMSNLRSNRRHVPYKLGARFLEESQRPDRTFTEEEMNRANEEEEKKLFEEESRRAYAVARAKVVPTLRSMEMYSGGNDFRKALEYYTQMHELLPNFPNGLNDEQKSSLAEVANVIFHHGPYFSEVSLPAEFRYEPHHIHPKKLDRDIAKIISMTPNSNLLKSYEEGYKFKEGPRRQALSAQDMITIRMMADEYTIGDKDKKREIMEKIEHFPPTERRAFDKVVAAIEKKVVVPKSREGEQKATENEVFEDARRRFIELAEETDNFMVVSGSQLRELRTVADIVFSSNPYITVKDKYKYNVDTADQSILVPDIEAVLDESVKTPSPKAPSPKAPSPLSSPASPTPTPTILKTDYGVAEALIGKLARNEKPTADEVKEIAQWTGKDMATVKEIVKVPHGLEDLAKEISLVLQDARSVVESADLSTFIDEGGQIHDVAGAIKLMNQLGNVTSYKETSGRKAGELMSHLAPQLTEDFLMRASVKDLQALHDTIGDKWPFSASSTKSDAARSVESRILNVISRKEMNEKKEDTSKAATKAYLAELEKMPETDLDHELELWFTTQNPGKTFTGIEIPIAGGKAYEFEAISPTVAGEVIKLKGSAEAKERLKKVMVSRQALKIQAILYYKNGKKASGIKEINWELPQSEF